MLDLGAAVVVLLFAALGILSGFLMQAFRLVAAAVGAYVALRYGADLMNAWPTVLAEAPAAREIAFPAALFAGAYLGLTLIARLIVAVLRRASPTLSVADRLLGGVVGALKGAVLCYFLVSLLLAAEKASGAPLPDLDTEGSRVAAFVKAHPVREVAELKNIRVLVEPRVPQAPAGGRDGAEPR
jgi:uncharacterized membrane protein required for colicin V production